MNPSENIGISAHSSEKETKHHHTESLAVFIISAVPVLVKPSKSRQCWVLFIFIQSVNV